MDPDSGTAPFQKGGIHHVPIVLDTPGRGDPCRLPSYYLAVNRDAASILALRTALAQTSTGGGACLPNGDLQCISIAQALASQNIQATTVVGASLTNGALTVFYDSNPAACVITPGDPCTPPSPI